MGYKYSKQTNRKKRKHKKKQTKKKSGGTWPPPSPTGEPYKQAIPGEKGGNLEHLDLILINVRKITTNYYEQNTKNIKELEENINKSFEHYMSKDIIEKKQVFDTLEEIENTYSTQRK